MKVNFRDFTSKQSINDYLVENSKKKVVKCECRVMDDNGVVVDHLDSFIENCGDIKYYFGDDESLEINRINSVAIFVRANGEKIMVEHIDNNFEALFVDMINKELGLDFKAIQNNFSYTISGELPTDSYDKFNKELDELCLNYKLNIEDN